MVGDSIRSINKQHMPYISINVLSAYKVNENYLIIVVDGEIVQKLVEFSSDRKCRRIQGFDLVNNSDISQFLNVDFNELTEKSANHMLMLAADFISRLILPKMLILCVLNLKTRSLLRSYREIYLQTK